VLLATGAVTTQYLVQLELNVTLIRLISIDIEESNKRHKEDARNTLESYLYRVRDLLDDDRENSPFVKCSKDAERRSISQKLEETFHWLSDEGEHADTNTLVEKRSTLE
jgi:hypoxia up-regulated 1